MNDKEKIVKYLKYKGLTKNFFCVQNGLSSGFLDSGTSLGVNKLRLISHNYQDLNIKWFFDDDEPMILGEIIITTEVRDPSPPYGKPDNTLMGLLIEKDKELKNSYEEIGRLKEIVRRFSTKDKNIKDVTIQ